MFRVQSKLARMQSILQQKLGRYLIYAAGEIILVVIGILIALQVNTRNEEKENLERFNKIFEQIRINLEQDILNAERTIRYYNTQDSLIQLVVNEQVTPQMFRENSSLFYLLYYYQAFTLTDNGYNLLSMELDKVPESYKEVMPYVHDVYKGYKPMFEMINMRVIDFTYRMLERWSREHSYYTLSEEEKIEFFMHSDAFRNDAMLSQRYTQDSFVRNLHIYIYKAMMIYTMLLELDKERPADLAGVYQDKFGALDTLRLQDFPKVMKEELDPAITERSPVYKKTTDRSNLFIRNNSDIPIRVEYQQDSSYLPRVIEPGKTVYARPVVGADYQFFHQGGNYLGTYRGVRSNSLLVLP